MKKHISDYLPAAMVRDLRQSIRNRIYGICLILGLPASLWILLGSPQGNGYVMAFLAIVLMWFIIPNRAGSAVTADAKVKSTNFMILTPLTSRRIVWSIWLSAVAQLTIVAAIGSLLLWWRHNLPEQAALTPELRLQDWMIYALIYAIGVLMCAIFMFLAQVSRIFRIAGEIFLLMYLWGFIGQILFILTVSNNPIGELFRHIAPYHYLLLGTNYILLLLTMLELSRRCYAAATENCSFMVRIYALCSLLSIPLFYACFPTDTDIILIHYTYTLLFITLACMSDAMLPTHSPTYRGSNPLLRKLAYLHTPGVGQSALVMLLMMLIYAGIGIWLNGTTHLNEAIAPEPANILCGIVSVTYLYLVAILLTDLSCKRSNINRPVVCFGYIIALAMFGGFISFCTHATAADAFTAIIPGCHPTPTDSIDIYASAAISLACSLIVLYTLMLRKGK